MEVYVAGRGDWWRWQVLLDGKVLRLCERANATEGWADVIQPAPSGIVRVDRPLTVVRLTGHVQIRRRP